MLTVFGHNANANFDVPPFVPPMRHGAVPWVSVMVTTVVDSNVPVYFYKFALYNMDFHVNTQVLHDFLLELLTNYV